MPDIQPIVPDYITVHMGPPDSDAPNERVRFTRYIKNIASAENDPNWPESALVANIYALITHTLNTMYTENYRGRGYNFDITNPTPGGTTFVFNREIFTNIGRIVDSIFNEYIVKGRTVQPYLAQYCAPGAEGCEGLTFQDSANLAESGYTPYQILQYYYGNDIGITRNAPVSANVRPYPGIPLMLGSRGKGIDEVQSDLNKISLYYPAIPVIPKGNGTFNEATQSAVKKFQEIFDLSASGIVDKAAWYKLQFINNIARTTEALYLKGITLANVGGLYKKEPEIGDSSDFINVLRFYLYFLSNFDDRIPPIGVGREFTTETQNAVRAFQKAYGLPADGNVNETTWNMMRQVYSNTLDSIPQPAIQTPLYPGKITGTGTGEKIVRNVQTYLFLIAQNDKSIPFVNINGSYDAKTKSAVKALQKEEGIQETGYIGPLTWAAIINRYNKIQKQR